MKVTEALYPNANPSAIKEDIKSFALNVMYNEDGGTLVNENGFKLHKDYSIYGTCIGTIPIPTGVVLFFVDNRGVSKKDTIIYHSDSSIEDGSATKDKIYLSVAYDEEKHTVFNFSEDRPITGSYSYNKNKHLIITWTEGNTDDANETRLLNLDTVYDDYAEFFGYSFSESDDAITYQFDKNYADIASFSKRLNLIPDVQYPQLDVRSKSNGSLLMGAYQFAIAYKLKTGEYTDYSPLSPVYYAAPLYNEDISVGNITSRRFEITFKDIDDQYDKCKIGIIFKTETDESAYEKYDVDIKNNTVISITSVSDLTKVDLNDIVIGTVSYIKDQAHTNFNSQLIRANVSTNNVSIIDDFIKKNKLNTKKYVDVYLAPITIDEGQGDLESVGSIESFRDNDLSNVNVVKNREAYILYFALIDYKGKIINAYPILNTETSYIFETYNFNNEADCNYYLYRWHIDATKAIEALFNDPTIKDVARKQIKGVAYYYAQATDSNKNWISTCLTIRDTEINNVVGNNYKYAFISNERFRVYPLEYLITNTKLPKCYLYPRYNAKERMTAEYVLNRADESLGIRDLTKIYTDSYEEGGDFIQSILDSTHLLLADDTPGFVDIDPMFYPVDNSAVSNSASDSCYKYTLKTKAYHNYIFGNILYPSRTSGDIGPDDTINPPYNRLDVNDDLKTLFNDALYEDGESRSFINKIAINNNAAYWVNQSSDILTDPAKRFSVLVENNRAIVDLVRHNNSDLISIFSSVDPYEQNLVAATPILAIKYKIDENNIATISNIKYELKGDVFLAWITQRCVTPARWYTHQNDTNNLHNDIGFCHRMIVSYFIPSRLNLQCIHSGNGVNFEVKKLFDRNKLTNYTQGNPEASMGGDKNSDYNYARNMAYKHQSIDNFWHTEDGTCYDLAMNHDGFKDVIIMSDFDDYTDNYPTRIIRSNVNPSEATDLGWRKYKADNYKDISIQKGQIENIMSDDVSLYIQQRFSLLVAAIKDTLSGGGSDDATYVGTSDIFQREPKEVIFSTTGKIGCNNRFSAIIISLGYIVCDNEKGEIFICKSDTDVKEISDIGFKEWFKHHVPKDAINPYTANGTYFLYDELNSRLIFTCKVLDANGDIDTSKAYTVSYSFKTGTWSSFHSYIGDYAYVNRKNSFYLKDSKLYEINAANKGIYFDNTINPSIVQFIYATEPTISKLFKHIEWRTQLIDGLLHKLKKIRYIYDKTFDHLMINTDVQSTGLIRLAKLPEWYASTDIKYKADRWLYNLIEDRIKTDSDYWNFNTNFLPFLSAKDVDDMIAISTIASKPWYEYAKIQNAWAYITFIYDNKFFNPNNNAYVETKDTKQLPFDYDEVITNDNLGNQEVKQLELRFTHVDVDVVKNNRV